MPNPFCHVELHSNDLEKSKEFYTRLFDWKLEEMPDGDHSYTMIRVGEGTGGGMMKAPMPGTASAWLALRVCGRHCGIHSESQNAWRPYAAGRHRCRRLRPFQCVHRPPGRALRDVPAESTSIAARLAMTHAVFGFVNFPVTLLLEDGADRAPHIGVIVNDEDCGERGHVASGEARLH